MTLGPAGLWDLEVQTGGGGGSLTHSWVVLAQGLLADGQGIIEQVGGLLVLVLVPGGRWELMNGVLQPKALLAVPDLWGHSFCLL